MRKVYPFGTIEIGNDEGTAFKVNGQRLKHYIADHPQIERFDQDLSDPAQAET